MSISSYVFLVFELEYCIFKRQCSFCDFIFKIDFLYIYKDDFARSFISIIDIQNDFKHQLQNISIMY